MIFALFLTAFSTSTFLSIPGIIPVISDYYSVSFEQSSLFVALFTFILAFSGLILPTYFSSVERKTFFIGGLLIFIISSVCQIFITDFYMALLFRLIPAFVYSSVISIALTIMSEISPKNTNRVILGVSAGTILGLSISTYVGMKYDLPSVNIWLALINIFALIFIILFFPKMEGKSKRNELEFGNSISLNFLITTVFIMFVGIAVSILYNYFSVILITMTNIDDQSLLSFYLLFNGFAAIFGTVLFGYLLTKNSKLAVFSYPIAFMIVIALFGFFIHIPIAALILIIAFGFLDGSMHTISQYWITSANKDYPEFSNGFYLFINNINRTIGIFIGAIIIDHFNLNLLFILSVLLLICSIPFVLLRIRRYPETVQKIS